MNSSTNITGSPLAVTVESAADHSAHSNCFYLYDDINYQHAPSIVHPGYTHDLVNFNNGTHPPSYESQYHHTYSVKFASC